MNRRTAESASGGQNIEVKNSVLLNIENLGLKTRSDFKALPV
jgi:hypothetical protein